RRRKCRQGHPAPKSSSHAQTDHPDPPQIDRNMPKRGRNENLKDGFPRQDIPTPLKLQIRLRDQYWAGRENGGVGVLETAGAG
ncbi:hypothetical protein B0H10DRAFT_2031036, partial [Mycena sp. CBHHK59/15]